MAVMRALARLRQWQRHWSRLATPRRGAVARSLVSCLGAIVLWLAMGPVGAIAGEVPESPGASASDTAEIVAALEWVDSAFEATNRGDFAAAEQYWSKILERFPDRAEIWSNRGNARTSQNKLDLAIKDYNRAIELAPAAPDPYLNRGAALENRGDFAAAIADYDRVLALDPNDAAAHNNRGNALGGLGRWPEAIENFEKAAALVPDFAIARENYALALYETGDQRDAIRHLRNLVRKYPRFADARAALTAVLWLDGRRGEAESQWVSVVGLDRRYKDMDWVRHVRRWPPSVADALDRFLNL